MFHSLFYRETAWWNDTIKTSDGKLHEYRAAERHSRVGTSIQLVFQEYGSFEAHSEQAACKIFKNWYNEHIKTDESRVRNQVRQSPVRYSNRTE